MPPATSTSPSLLGAVVDDVMDDGTAIRPVGREEVMAAVLTAATELFAQRGPDAVTVREVADRAGVNHALIHRHYGTKDELLRVVLAQAAERMDAVSRVMANSRDDLTPVVSALRAEDQCVRLLAWAILSGYPVKEIWPEHLAARRLQAVLSDERRDAERTGDVTDPRAVVATAQAMLLGWMVFLPFLERAGDLGNLDGFDEAAVLDDAVQALLDRSR